MAKEKARLCADFHSHATSHTPQHSHMAADEYLELEGLRTRWVNANQMFSKLHKHQPGFVSCLVHKLHVLLYFMLCELQPLHACSQHCMPGLQPHLQQTNW